LPGANLLREKESYQKIKNSHPVNSGGEIFFVLAGGKEIISDHEAEDDYDDGEESVCDK
jgi:hypothetical protein